MATFEKPDPKALIKGLAESGRVGAQLELAVAERANAAARLFARIARADLQRAVERKAPPKHVAALKQKVRSVESALAPAAARAEQALHRSKAGAPLFGGAPPIVGRVVDAKGGGVRGAAVTLSGEGDKPLARTKSDASGYFRMAAPPAGTGDLRLWIGGTAECPLWETRVSRVRPALQSTFHVATIDR
jgi:hypothetical protein